MERRAGIAIACLAFLAVAAVSSAEGETASTHGKLVYEQYCVTCHGVEGKGDGPAGVDLLPMPRDFSVGRFKFDADSDGHTGTDEDLFLVIRDGGAAVGGNPLMAPWGHLGDDTIRDLVAYIRSLGPATTK